MTDKEKKQELKKLLRKAGYKVYVIQRGVSQSGMTRKLDLIVFVKGFNCPLYTTQYITQTASELLGWGLDKNGYLIVKGCGMDMHFHTVYSLSAVLYGYKNRGGYKLTYKTL